jgi:hypothetical protein
MDAEYKWLKILTLDGYITINVEAISEIQRVGNGLSIKMFSGSTILLNYREAKRFLSRMKI